MPIVEPPENIKLVFFSASSVVIPTLNKLLQSQQLAGVVLNSRIDADSQQLELQLKQAHISCIRYQVDKPELVVQQIASWQANTGLIFTFAHKLPPSLLSLFSYGLFNLHASDLPKYRGAMPLYWQIRNREAHGCLSIIKVEQAFDCGDIMLQQHLPLLPQDTLNSFANTMAQQSPDFVLKFIAKLKNGELIARPQKGESSSAAMPSQQDLLVDWQIMSSEAISAMARAGNPWLNGVMIIWQQSLIGLLQATPVEYPSYDEPAGTVLHVGEPEGLIVASMSGALRLDILIITEGVFTGIAFAERFGLDAGVRLG